VDHILGFFRIWEIPGDCSMGLLGRFRPSEPIRRHELEGRGLWDIDRLCDPYVTQALLAERFGRGLAMDLARTYFEPGAGGRLKLRPEFGRHARGSGAGEGLPAGPAQPQLSFQANSCRRRDVLSPTRRPLPRRSEKAILAIAAPEGTSPAEIEEVEFVKTELLALRQNVALLRDPDEPDSFYPVSFFFVSFPQLG
jgi:4-alpha-glucanotransferase